VAAIIYVVMVLIVAKLLNLVESKAAVPGLQLRQG
jgi:ABC-type amino acid transport system permease subunit